MRQTLALGLGWLAVTLSIGCASKPPPPPAQAEVPIRTQDEIARDQAGGGTIADPAQCSTNNPPPNCPHAATGNAFEDTRSGHRLPRMLGK